MEQKITLVRHGSLPEEFSHSLIGVCDVPLSERGRAEALACGRYLARGDYDGVYSGTLARVRETMTLASSVASGLPNAAFDERLNEMDFGDWSFTPAEARPPHSWDIGDPQFSFPNGENMGGFIERTRAVLADVRNSGLRRPVIFSHGGVIMALLADLVGLERSRQFNIWVERGSVAEVACSVSGVRLNRIFRPLDFM